MCDLYKLRRTAYVTNYVSVDVLASTLHVYIHVFYVSDLSIARYVDKPLHVVCAHSNLSLSTHRAAAVFGVYHTAEAS